LQFLGREVIDNYFLLYERIEEFRRNSGSATAEILQRELQALIAIVDQVRADAGEESAAAQGLLAEDDAAP
jgi:hypothetical protein